MNIKPTTSLAAVLILSAAAASPVHAAMPGGSTVYAGLWSTNEDTPVYGIYSLGTDGPELKLADPKGSQIGYPMRSGWIADGKLCGYYVKESYSIVEEHYYIISKWMPPAPQRASTSSRITAVTCSPPPTIPMNAAYTATV